MQLIGTKLAAQRLGVSPRRLRFLCRSGRLGTLIAGRWLISEAELGTFHPLPVGRPPKSGRERKLSETRGLIRRVHKTQKLRHVAANKLTPALTVLRHLQEHRSANPELIRRAIQGIQVVMRRLDTEASVAFGNYGYIRPVRKQ